jgi:hypothetical protein
MESGSIIMVGQLSEKGEKIKFRAGKNSLKECEAMQELTGLTIGLESV